MYHLKAIFLNIDRFRPVQRMCSFNDTLRSKSLHNQHLQEVKFITAMPCPLKVYQES